MKRQKETRTGTLKGLQQLAMTKTYLQTKNMLKGYKSKFCDIQLHSL